MSDLELAPAPDTAPGTAPTAAPATAPEPKPALSAWDQLFAQLRSRFPKATESVLFCINELQQGDRPLDELKAQAAMHGIRVTGQSLNAARRLLAPPTARQPGRTEPLQPERPPREAEQRPQPAAKQPEAPRRERVQAPPAAGDLEAQLRDAVGRMTGAADARAERLEKAVRAAIEALRAGLEE